MRALRKRRRPRRRSWHPHAMPVTIGDLEAVAAKGWRAPEETRLGGWLLRAARGFTGRANSALAAGDPGMPLTEAVTEVCRWYAARDLPAMRATSRHARSTRAVGSPTITGTTTEPRQPAADQPPGATPRERPTGTYAGAVNPGPHRARPPLARTLARSTPGGVMERAGPRSPPPVTGALSDAHRYL
jgi:N-acetylglutamate synthase